MFTGPLFKQDNQGLLRLKPLLQENAITSSFSFLI
jgi:hypothetical protein